LIGNRNRERTKGTQQARWHNFFLIVDYVKEYAISAWQKREVERLNIMKIKSKCPTDLPNKIRPGGGQVIESDEKKKKGKGDGGGIMSFSEDKWPERSRQNCLGLRKEKVVLLRHKEEPDRKPQGTGITVIKGSGKITDEKISNRLAGTGDKWPYYQPVPEGGKLSRNWS